MPGVQLSKRHRTRTASADRPSQGEAPLVALRGFIGRPRAKERTDDAALALPAMGLRRIEARPRVEGRRTGGSARVLLRLNLQALASPDYLFRGRFRGARRKSLKSLQHHRCERPDIWAPLGWSNGNRGMVGSSVACPRFEPAAPPQTANAPNLTLSCNVSPALQAVAA
jgi:hypothetical protein